MSKLKIKAILVSAFSLAFLCGSAFWATFSILTNRIETPRFVAAPNENARAVREAGKESEPLQNLSLLNSLKREFQRRNADIEKVFVMDMRPIETSLSSHLVLGRATCRDTKFKGSFEDELFGLFIVDAASNRIEKIVDIIPTPRFLDTEMRIEKIRFDEAEIVGKSRDLGHVEFRRKYKF